MRPEVRELLLASFAETENPSRIEAFLRLKMDRLRRQAQGWNRDLPPQARLELTEEALRKAEVRLRDTLSRAEALQAFLLTPWDDEYPRRLRTIAGPPAVLYGRGDRSADLSRSIAVVGTRTPSRWGSGAAARIGRFFAERGWTVISGLAVGLDRHVHEAVVRSGGVTVAVTAAGLDRIAPASHRPLAEDIIRNRGLLLSELGFGIEATPASRIRRDRIQSGIGVATIVVETEEGGGAMHTARFAVDQGRPLYVPVPPDTTSFQSRGALKLLYRDRTAHPFEVPGGLDAVERELVRFVRD